MLTAVINSFTPLSVIPIIISFIEFLMLYGSTIVRTEIPHEP